MSHSHKATVLCKWWEASYQACLVSPTNAFVCAACTQWPCWHDACMCVYVCTCIIRFKANHSHADLMPPNSIPVQLNLVLLAKAIQPPSAPPELCCTLIPCGHQQDTITLSVCLTHFSYGKHSHALSSVVLQSSLHSCAQKAASLSAGNRSHFMKFVKCKSSASLFLASSLLPPVSHLQFYLNWGFSSGCVWVGASVLRDPVVAHWILKLSQRDQGCWEVL